MTAALPRPTPAILEYLNRFVQNRGTEPGGNRGYSLPAGPPRIALRPSQLQSALDLAARGFAVFPLRPNSKLPLLRGWPELATTDTSQIQKWWMKHPDANIGIATGEKSGILVIDVDGEPGRASLAILESKHGALPPTRTVKSIRPDRGEHRYFKFPAGIRIKNSASKVGAGIDVKSSGGQTVGRWWR